MPALARLEDGKVASCCLHGTQTLRKQPRLWEHPHTHFNPGPKVAGGSSEQRDARWLPEAPGQVAGLLDHELGGDDAQVHGQQLVALHYLCLVVLAVITQQLPGEEKIWGVPEGFWGVLSGFWGF